MTVSSMEHKNASRTIDRDRCDEEIQKPVTWEPSQTFLQASVIAILSSGLLVSAAIYFFIPGLSPAVRMLRFAPVRSCWSALLVGLP
jgi:hypothetical protein